ncbi:hypothetical protein CF060_12290 [Clostridium botulinum]|uniref:hypothetical protein n=1 Tax=Clostridium botulinum TaxID=1491 RepID=UPI000947C259|nr:hypothetical protein [Clostridium botulinum]AUM98325.1 hypothetical protein RSJ13_04655 [Clostridium botulinum]MBN3354861.1 hypothetical protein [Clostridium botulinum]MCC5422680.1 hypothetical protein [Clostridium botulinum]QDY28140.1 hypothetical protein CGQ41_04715 [Clostridium botulinum]
MQICVPNKDREDVINKVLVVLESISVNIDTLIYCISDFPNIGQLKVKNLILIGFLVNDLI